uniref:Uncharacterized protein n=1 Tax=Schizaphis graminum TaxID=13262 RepID=A0A2S2PNY9_SCHGA
MYSLLEYVLRRNKGPINYLKVLVNNKKNGKPAKIIMPISRVVSANPVVAVDHGSPTIMTFRNVYLHVTTKVPRSSTTDYGGNSYVKADGDKRIVSGEKTVTRQEEDDALVQRMCSEIISAVHRKIGEQLTATVASDTAAHRKSEPQQQERRRHSYRKISPRPVRENNRVDTLTSCPLAKSSNGVGAVDEGDDDRCDEDADQAPKVLKLNTAGEQVMLNSAKSREPPSDVSVDDIHDDDDDHTS